MSVVTDWALEDFSLGARWTAELDWPDFSVEEPPPVPEISFEVDDSVPPEPEGEAERRLAEALADAEARGHAEGVASERLRLHRAAVAVDVALDAIEEGEVRWREALEENVAALAIAIAKQVIEREMSVETDVVEDLVRRAARKFPLDHAIRVRLAPGDLAMLTEAGEAAPSSGVVEGREVRWMADPLITPGGCMVEGRERIIDGRVDTALERIYRRLTNTDA
jgi:flagellar biosynthesis/type III secretory pathway protein FliH